MDIRVPAVALLAVGQAALAQPVPSAGGQLKQIPPVVAVPKAAPDIRIDSEPPAALRETTTEASFAVVAVRITGATIFSEAELIAATGFRPGPQSKLADLRAMASRITEFYNTRGYFVARAYVPAQDLAGGTVTLAVIEGRYDKVEVRNSSRLKTAAADRILRGVDQDDVVANAPLERRLLILSDTPGIAVKSTLAPGAAVGTSDLLVDVTPGRRFAGSAEFDNAGNRYTGYFRAGGSVSFANPLGLGDEVLLRGLVSDRGLTYVRGAYQAPVAGVTLGVAYARLDYRLHREFRALDAHGSADIASLYASYPLVRSYNHNLNALAGVDFKFFNDAIDSVGAVSSKRSQVGFAGVSGDARDKLGGGGSSFYSLVFSGGALDIRTPAVRFVDDLMARSNGGFGKVNLAVGRSQALGGPLSLYVSARGQLATGNLDISEKMELGGAYAVRAYPEGEAYGDQGYVATAELRLDLATLSRQVPGDVQLFGFVDNGGVTFNRDRYAIGRNHANLTGAGAGVSWAANGGFLVKASYAHRLGDTRVVSQPDHAGRFWFQLVKLF